eukprot:2367977-Alexandrium_andersonii.AAC.1
MHMRKRARAEELLKTSMQPDTKAGWQAIGRDSGPASGRTHRDNKANLRVSMRVRGNRGTQASAHAHALHASTQAPQCGRSLKYGCAKARCERAFGGTPAGNVALAGLPAYLIGWCISKAPTKLMRTAIH